MGLGFQSWRKWVTKIDSCGLWGSLLSKKKRFQILISRADKSVTIATRNYNPFYEQAIGLNSCDTHENVDVCKLVTELLPARMYVCGVDRRCVYARSFARYRYSIIVSHTDGRVQSSTIVPIGRARYGFHFENLLIMYRAVIFAALTVNRILAISWQRLSMLINDKAHVPRDKMQSLCKTRYSSGHYRRVSFDAHWTFIHP